MIRCIIRAKARLHEALQADRSFSACDRARVNPCGSLSIAAALEFVDNPARTCAHVHSLINSLVRIVLAKKDDPKTKGDAICTWYTAAVPKLTLKL